jgi:protein-S-isoprenylcysteine O-methyltransferase Ste14
VSPDKLSIAGLVLMMAAVVGLFYTHALFTVSPIVILVQAAAVALMIWARLTFGRRSFHATAEPTEGGLVTTGPYRFIRNPIYTAASMFCWAGILGNPGALSVVCGLVLLTGAILRILPEERMLVRRYPDYLRYAHATKRMIPFVF